MNSNFSDHSPFCLQLDGVKKSNYYPFKFNHMWLDEEDFCSLVRNSWKSFLVLDDFSVMDKIVLKIKILKKKVVLWENVKHIKSNKELVEIEDLMEHVFDLVLLLYLLKLKRRRDYLI